MDLADYVLECFRRGEFDFVDGVSEVAETEYFRYIGTKKILRKLAEICGGRPSVSEPQHLSGSPFF